MNNDKIKKLIKAQEFIFEKSNFKHSYTFGIFGIKHLIRKNEKLCYEDFSIWNNIEETFIDTLLKGIN